MVVPATMRVGTFGTFYTLINNNKLSGWTVQASEDNVDTVLPCIVINPAQFKNKNITMNGGTKERNMEITIQLFTDVRDGLTKLDAGADNVENSINSNQATLHSANLMYDGCEDTAQNTYTEGQQKINYRAISFKLRLN